MNCRVESIVGLALVLALLSSCSGSEQDADKHDELLHSQHEHRQMSSAEAMSGQSLYQLNSVWTNQQGEQITLNSFAGKIVVLAMVYTHCDYACPRIIADMRLIGDALENKAGQISFVLVSIDTKRDTVERLKNFGEVTGLTKQGWTLLRGDEADIRELAAVFGVQYRQTSDTDFAHSNIISVLNQQGEIRHQQEGLGVRFDATVTAISKLL
jgi:protein SCO1/2